MSQNDKNDEIAKKQAESDHKINGFIHCMRSAGAEVDISAFTGAVSEITQELVADVCTMVGDASIQTQLSGGQDNRPFDEAMQAMFDGSKEMDAGIQKLSAAAVVKFPA